MKTHRRRLLALTLPAILALIVVAAVTTGAQGNTYFVATNGSDASPGSLASPWLTIAHAVAQLNPGDTLLIRGGTYTGWSNTIDTSLYAIKSGTSTSPITISAYPGGLAASTTVGPRAGAEVVTIRPPGPATAGIMLTLPAGTAPSHLVFEDLVIDGVNNAWSEQPPTGPCHGNGQVVVYTSGGASYNQFIHLEIKNNGGSGLTFSQNNGNADHNQVLYCAIHDNGTDTCFSESGYGLYTESNYNTFSYNDIYSNGGYGHQMRGYGNQVNNNKFHHNLVKWIGTGVGGTTGGGFNMVSNPPQPVGNNNTFFNNLSYNNGFSLSTGLAVSGTAATGVLIYSYEQNATVFNNTIYGNYGDGLAFQYYDGTAPPIAENNISFGNHGNQILDAGSLTGTTLVALRHNLTANPSFVNASATAPDLHLQVGSAAINAGMTINAVTTDFDGIARPQGPAYSIGAYEFISAVTAISIPTGFQIN